MSEASIQMNAAEELERRFLNWNGREAKQCSDVHGKRIVYAITNGSDILSIDHGRTDRLIGLMPGGKCPKHKKAFIVAATQAVFVCQNRFFYLPTRGLEEARAITKKLHSKFNSTVILGLGKNPPFNEVAARLWEDLRAEIECGQRLDAVMELVCLHGDILIKVLEIDDYAQILKEEVLKGYYT